MDPDRQQQKVIAKGVTEGILKAVGILAVLGVIAGIVFAIGNTDFSSGTTSYRQGLPVIVLVVNETSDSLLLEWHADTAFGRHVIPRLKRITCERFYVQGPAGKLWRTSFAIRNLRSGQRDSSGWFQLNMGGAETSAWVDTVRVGRHHMARIRDLNLLAANDCSAY